MKKCRNLCVVKIKHLQNIKKINLYKKDLHSLYVIKKKVPVG